MNSSDRSAVILIVEDDPNDILFLQRAFKKAGLTLPVRLARDGQEAIDYLSSAGPFCDRERFPIPCLIILDLKLPKRSGIEVLQWLRRQEDYRDMPVVMVTSDHEKGDRELALNEGVEAFHIKPMSIDELVAFAGDIRIKAEDHCKDAKPFPQER